uniref:disintegrin and metalloproteinase domain-containing protein 10 isoform X2 n=1 Tax=Myxine glutinosa TaxID=7769 RepID=UPI00358EFA1F
MALVIAFALYGNPLGKYIRHFEGLSYSMLDLHDKHHRAKRALFHDDKIVHLNFHAHGRHFNLRLKRDTSLFTEDFVEDSGSHGALHDTSHIYSGEIYGEDSSMCHGSIINGRFEGFVSTYAGAYYIEPVERYFPKDDMHFHSVMYHENDIDYPHKYGPSGGCADNAVFERMRKIQISAVPEEPTSQQPKSKTSSNETSQRNRRAVDTKNTCLLFIQTDHLFFKYYQSKEAVIAQIASHVKAVNVIYHNANFDGIRGITFMVKRVRINTTDNTLDRSNPFRFSNLGVEKFLELNSEQNHDDYCLAYVFTDRDFDDGVLGLAWVAASSGSSGGICENHKLYSDMRRKSLNTGIITVQNYGAHVPTKVSHITFAHEVGHNFGSPHDSGPSCTPGTSTRINEKEKGNYIMYARATSGDKSNNNRFSPCSIANISLVLQTKQQRCFVESGQPICGNGIVEESEQCDCGYIDQCRDKCCHHADASEELRCRLQLNARCSPSQGPCCSSECKFRPMAQVCRKDSECAHIGVCNGFGASCPTSPPKRNFTVCNQGTQVCVNGQCTGSICERYHLEECTCENADDDKIMCHLCCMTKGKPDTCQSSGSDSLKDYFNGTTILLQPGSPCNDFKGYCDVFLRCRLVDADGPLARLKKAIFNPELYENIAEWIRAYWWAVGLMVLALMMLMAGFIKICSVHTPTSNPKLPPHKHLSETLRVRKPRPRPPAHTVEQQQPMQQSGRSKVGQPPLYEMQPRQRQ